MLEVQDELTTIRERVYRDINEERRRQIQLRESGELVAGDRRLSNARHVAILTEQSGSVSRTVLDMLRTPEGEIPDHLIHVLRSDLISLATSAIAWIELLDRENP